ncbi:hypothetical protein F53441_7822 [Fusarium austroafricanum]|uniref:Uncharacterized protein n=1 Tax=Fusarium austroafricanum TaxID=2364996 RepID=A0A8H4NV31_9HYPO|nr:hypothetical protein F53441_7822 [Fusarium austroafricanum]
MRFTPLLLLLPVISASWLPIKPWLRIRDQSPEDCTVTSTFSPVTLTSIYPTSTIGSSAIGSQGHGQATGSGSLIYTTALPTLGPNGPGLHTYTITAPCTESQCHRPAATDCPPGFTTTAVICHVCGEQLVTTTLTLPIESATAAHGSDGGDTHNGVSTLTAFVSATSHKTISLSSIEVYPWISRHGPEVPGATHQPQVPGAEGPKHGDPEGSHKSDASPENLEVPKSLDSPQPSALGEDTNPQRPTSGSPNGVPTGAGSQAGDGAKAGSESASPTSPSDEARPNSPTAVVVTGRASQAKLTGGALFKVVLFAVMVLYPLYV